MVSVQEHASSEVGGAVRIVRWPVDRDQRIAAARDGLPCLLVLERGDPIPAVADHEDWIVETADERDVAARVVALRDRAATVPGPSATEPAPIPELPAGLADADHRLARVLVTRAGHLVARSDLDARCDAGDPLDGAMRRLRNPMRRAGWLVHKVGEAGYLVERVDP